MLVKFLSNKDGGTKGAVKYLLNERVQDGTAKVLKGDPKQTLQIIGAMEKYKQRHTLGVLSFEKEDKLTEKNKIQIMALFEKSLLPHMKEEEYNILWVEHTDKGRLELNFVIPKLNLLTGKTFNPYWDRADRPRVDAFKDFTNTALNLANPNEAHRKQLVKKNNKNKENLKYNDDPMWSKIEDFIFSNAKDLNNHEELSQRFSKLEEIAGYPVEIKISSPKAKTAYISIKPIIDTGTERKIKAKRFKTEDILKIVKARAEEKIRVEKGEPKIKVKLDSTELLKQINYKLKKHGLEEYTNEKLANFTKNALEEGLLNEPFRESNQSRNKDGNSKENKLTSTDSERSTGFKKLFSWQSENDLQQIRDLDTGLEEFKGIIEQGNKQQRHYSEQSSNIRTQSSKLDYIVGAIERGIQERNNFFKNRTSELKNFSAELSEQRGSRRNSSLKDGTSELKRTLDYKRDDLNERDKNFTELSRRIQGNLKTLIEKKIQLRERQKEREKVLQKKKSQSQGFSR